MEGAKEIFKELKKFNRLIRFDVILKKEEVMDEATYYKTMENIVNKFSIEYGKYDIDGIIEDLEKESK